MQYKGNVITYAHVTGSINYDILQKNLIFNADKKSIDTRQCSNLTCEM